MLEPIAVPLRRLASGALTAALLIASAGCGPGTQATAGPEAPAHPAGHAAHWSYEGPTGPEHWGELSPEFAACGAGHEQSPIDIAGANGAAVPPITFEYKPAPAKVVNNGHTIEVRPDAGSAIRIGGETYALAQFHFHTPSEHHVAGKTYPLELHFVHKNAAGKLAVVGVLIDAGAENAVLAPVWSALPRGEGEEKPAGAPVDVAALLPKDTAYFHYAGSLTTPPCSEGVSWNVLKTPIQLSQGQIDAFKAIFPLNARPVQALHGRPIEG